MVACNLDLKPAYKVTPAGQERHHTNETFAWYHSTGPPQGAGGIPPVRWPRWAKSRSLYYFWLCNRGKRKNVEQARWNINFSC
jgi:hypothetical protein